MNTVKLYQFGDGDFVMQITPTKQYTILNGAIVKSNINVAELTEISFDITLMANISNALTNVTKLVTSEEVIELIQALAQEKVEDFD